VRCSLTCAPSGRFQGSVDWSGCSLTSPGCYLFSQFLSSCGLHRIWVHWPSVLLDECEHSRGNCRCKMTEDVCPVRTARCLVAETVHQGYSESMVESARESEAASHLHVMYTSHAYWSDRLCQLRVLTMGKPFRARWRQQPIPKRLVTTS